MKPCPKYQPDLALLAAGAVEDSQRPPLLAHTAGCPACRQYLNELSEVCRAHAVAAHSGSTLDPSPGFRRRLAERIRAEESVGGQRFLSGWGSWILALRWRVALPLAGVALMLILLASQNTTVPHGVSSPDGSTALPSAEGDVPTQFWGCYQSAVRESFDALDQLLARDAIVASAAGVPVTAGMREIAGLTE